MGPKKSTLLFLLVIVSLLSVVLAGGHRKLIVNSELKENSLVKGHPYDDHEVYVAHSRILAVQTNDYGKYDPSPSLDKPPFKLIPNK